MSNTTAKAKAKPAPKAKARPAPKAKAKSKPPGKPPRKGMTDLERSFANEYLVTLNATESYLAVKPRVKRKTAEAEGWKLLRKPEVDEYIAARRKEIEEDTGVRANQVVREIARLGFFDPRKLFDKDGHPLPITKLDDATAAAISGIKVVTKGNVEMGFAEILEYKIADKNSALEKLMKHLGLYEKDNKQKSDPLSDLLKAISDQSRGVDGYGSPDS